MLERAASTVRDYREQLGCELPEGSFVQDLRSMAEMIDLYDDAVVKLMLLEAVAAIKTARSHVEHSLDAEQEDLIEELNNPDGTTRT